MAPALDEPDHFLYPHLPHHLPHPFKKIDYFLIINCSLKILDEGFYL
jgi:hypothetical protein